MIDQSIEDALLDSYNSSANALNHIAVLWLAVVPESREPAAAAPLYGGGLAHIIGLVQDHVEKSHQAAKKALSALRQASERQQSPISSAP